MNTTLEKKITNSLQCLSSLTRAIMITTAIMWTGEIASDVLIVCMSVSFAFCLCFSLSACLSVSLPACRLSVTVCLSVSSPLSVRPCLRLCLPPRWPRGKGGYLGSGKSGVRFPLAPWEFFRVESYHRLTQWLPC